MMSGIKIKTALHPLKVGGATLFLVMIRFMDDFTNGFKNFFMNCLIN